MAESGTQQETEKAKEGPPSYPRERLIEESGEFFGLPSHVVTAALSMGRAAQKKSFTRDEVDALVKGYMNHVVETDHPTGQEE